MTTQSLSSAPASSSTIAFSNRDYNAAQIYSSPHAPRGPYLPPPHHSPSPLGGSITIPTDSAPASPVPPASGAASPNLGVQSNGRPAAKTSRSKPKAQVAPVAGTKRRCVSNACVACRKRKSKVCRQKEAVETVFVMVLPFPFLYPPFFRVLFTRHSLMLKCPRF